MTARHLHIVAAHQDQVAEKTCTRCKEPWPADTEFFRLQAKPGSAARLAPWCRACESDYQHERRTRADLHEFRITVPGYDPFRGLFPNANAARLQAEQICPEAHPASVVCTSRLRQEARP